MARKDQFNARFDAALLGRLRRHAGRAGASQSALAERYIDEGLRMDEHPLIYFRTGTGGRRPALIGTRLDVWQVVETVRENGNAAPDAAGYLGVHESHVEACLAYYVAYENEIDEWIARERETAEEAEASWRRRRELFA